ncbi:hypothetical protein [Hydrogenobaculum acidophilum]
MSAHKEIYLFLLEGNKKGYIIIRNIFNKQINKSFYHNLKDKEEDLFSEVVLRLYEKKEYILTIFEGKEEGLASYIRTVIKNILNDAILSMSKNPIDNIYIDSRYEYEGIIPDEERFRVEAVDVMVKLEAKEVMMKFKSNLREEDFKLLCYILENKDDEKDKMEKILFKDVSKDALYKRVERLKKKLSQIVEENNFSEEAVGLCLQYIAYRKCREVLK